MLPRPKPNSYFAKPKTPQHVLPLYATRCDRCGLQALYAGAPDAPPCITDELLRSREAAARVMRRR
jgi:hypothetical protein